MATGTTAFSQFGTTGAFPHAPPVLPHFEITIATYFGYTPNVGLAVSATVLYSLACAVLTILCIGFWRRNVLYFLVLPLVAGSMECLSYGLRATMAINGTVPPSWAYIVSLVMIIVAPIFIALGNYLLCGRIVRFVGKEYSLFRPAIIERFFVIADVASFLVQGIGASIFASQTTSTSPNQNVIDLAQAILIAGFVIQLAAMALFLCTCIVLQVRTGRAKDVNISMGKWRKLFAALYTSVSMVFIRTIYRTIEFEAAHGSALATELSSKEVYFGIFETLCMFVAFAVYIPLHPGFNPLVRSVDDGLPMTDVESSTPQKTPR